MKFILAMLAVLFATTAMAAQPTMVDCTSDDGKLQVVYISSSFAGPPTFKVVKNLQDLFSEPFVVVQFKYEQTVLGLLVSASVHSTMTVDAPDAVYALMVPGVELGEARSTKLNALYLEGFVGGFQALPAIFQTVSTSRILNCVATRADF